MFSPHRYIEYTIDFKNIRAFVAIKNLRNRQNLRDFFRLENAMTQRIININCL